MREIAFLIAVFCTGHYRCAIAQVKTAAQTPQDDDLKAFLITYVESHGMKASETRYADAFIDLNGDGVDEAVVYLAGRDWCGTGGCLTLVLRRAGISYHLVARVAATRPPIRALRERTHSWRTLTAWASGGGIVRGYDAELPFDGTSYPISAAPPSARRLPGNPEGEVVIPVSAGDLRTDKILSAGRGPNP